MVPDDFLQTISQLPEHVARIQNVESREQLLRDVLDCLRGTDVDDKISVAAGLAYEGIRAYERSEKAKRLTETTDKGGVTE